MAFRASHRYARISARKVRPLADLVRGKLADEALVAAVEVVQPKQFCRSLCRESRQDQGGASERSRNSASSSSPIPRACRR